MQVAIEANRYEPTWVSIVHGPVSCEEILPPAPLLPLD